jgi:hypothetical protein
MLKWISTTPFAGGDIRDSRADPTLARERLGFEAEVGLRRVWPGCLRPARRVSYRDAVGPARRPAVDSGVEMTHRLVERPFVHVRLFLDIDM